MKSVAAPFRQGLKIAAAYAAVGAVWVGFSDRLVSSLTEDQDLLTLLQTIKGWAFVAVSAVLILVLSTRAVAREQLVTRTLRSSETALRGALMEKEVLLGEIHHRVRNNLQLVVSLLTLGAAKLRDAQARGALDDALARIQAIGLVHQHLYETGDFSRIDFAEYARDLCCSLAKASPTQRVRIEFDLEHFECDPGHVIPMGMILVELVSNAMKHAFPGDRSGKIMVRLHRHCPKRILLEVTDDGIGIADEPLRGDRASGLDLARMMTAQLQGELAHAALPDGGTVFRVDIGCEDCPTGTMCAEARDRQLTGSALRA